MKEEAWFDGSAGGDVAIDIDGNSGLHERGSGARGARASSSSTSSAQPNAFEGLQDKIVYEVAGRMFQQAQTQAGGYMNLYANLELIKPYFDVELSTVLRRIKLSFVPRQSSELLTSGAPDLYGPTMLVFTLVAILLLGMKLSHKTVEEGTLMGSAFGLCFSYWVMGSLGMRFAAYLCGMPLSLLEALSLSGYGLGGYCLGLVVHYLLHPISPVLSTVALLVAGGMSAATLACVFWADLRQRNQSKAAITAGCVGAIHFLFLLYIRFFYASLYDAAAAAF
ncbi:Yip1 domain containing protein [Acanthamoeba castellanii str. Neff]|uniref:Yip1 domain containing protein n=1 Tax=Acanthamoeba castellanii (strain ATCC 30010 / Neff) TaxID=1257118 RepID=L8H9Q2_ACACF|nr:Yip1 domain containing protein [Acanthamoeba castellanii str. Neff]ELR21136.1 Yip1 domain containing protein [Acanthamoeba castellanii str. Neff]